MTYFIVSIRNFWLSILLICSLTVLATSQEALNSNQPIFYYQPKPINEAETLPIQSYRKVLLDNQNVRHFSNTTQQEPSEKSQGVRQTPERYLPTYTYYNYYYGVIYYSTYSYNYYYSSYYTKYSSKYTYSGYSYYYYLSSLSYSSYLSQYYSYYSYLQSSYSKYSYYSYSSYSYYSYLSYISYQSYLSSYKYAYSYYKNRTYTSSYGDSPADYIEAIVIPVAVTFALSMGIGCCAIPLCCKTRFKKGIQQNCISRKATKKCKCCKKKKPWYKRHNSEYQKAVERGLVSGSNQPHVVPTMAPYYQNTPTVMPMQQPYQYGQQPYVLSHIPAQQPYQPIEQPVQQPYYPQQQQLGVQQYQPIQQTGMYGHQAYPQPMMDVQPQQVAYIGQQVYYENQPVQQTLIHQEQEQVAAHSLHQDQHSIIGNISESVPLQQNQSPDPHENNNS